MECLLVLSSTGCLARVPDSSVWLRFETWIWVVFLLVQMSVVVFLVVHGRADKSFRQAFHVLFIAVTIVDCILILLRPSARWFYYTVFGISLDYLPWKDPKTNGTAFYSYTLATINQATLHIIIPVFAHAQPLFLTAIAANRFTALCFPLTHATMWSARRLVIVVFVLVVTSVLLGAGLPVGTFILQAVKCAAATRKERVDLDCSAKWAFEQSTIAAALLTLTSAICCVVSVVLNIGSITALLVHRSTGTLRQKAPEIRLFVHSLYIFLLQAFLAFQEFAYVMANPEWVFYEIGLDLDRQTILLMRDTWEPFLIGELVLREYPEFTIRALAHCLLALSGSVFLLIISANIRNAFFKFYFRCLQRKRKRHSSVNVVHVSAGRRAQERST